MRDATQDVTFVFAGGFRANFAAFAQIPEVTQHKNWQEITKLAGRMSNAELFGANTADDFPLFFLRCARIVLDRIATEIHQHQNGEHIPF